jgi:hypothetical protein
MIRRNLPLSSAGVVFGAALPWMAMGSGCFGLRADAPSAEDSGVVDDGGDSGDVASPRDVANPRDAPDEGVDAMEGAVGEAATCLPPPAGIVSWWSGDDVFTDLVGTNEGAAVGNVPFVAGEVLDAFSFTGASYVEVPDSPSLAFAGTACAITIEAWVNSVSLSDQRVVDKAHAYGTDGYVLDIYHGGLRFLFGANWVSAQAPPLGRFSHIAGTYDGATLTLYLNGNLANTFPYSTQIQSNGLSLLIGAANPPIPGYPATPASFDGAIDEVTIYDRALTLSEIQGIYEAGPLGKCKP